MSNVTNRETFETAYAGQPPWEIGRPQPAILEVADQVRGDVLDVGCGLGEHALLFAKRGLKVTGIDFHAAPIERAQRQAAERGLAVTFLMHDALELSEFPEQFDTVVDSGLFHVFDDEERKHYVAGLGSVTRPGGKLILLCFSNDEPGEVGPRRVSQRELTDAFVLGWAVESIEASRFQVADKLPPGVEFSPGGAQAWLAILQRQSIDS